MCVCVCVYIYTHILYTHQYVIKTAGQETSHKYTNIQIYIVNTTNVLQEQYCQSSLYIKKFIQT